jgi:hypothetical protein
MTDEYVVRDNPELRYEILRHGEVVGGIWYRTAPGVIVPVCPFVGAYLRRHRERRDLVVRDPATPE